MLNTDSVVLDLAVIPVVAAAFHQRSMFDTDSRYFGFAYSIIIKDLGLAVEIFRLLPIPQCSLSHQAKLVTIPVLLEVFWMQNFHDRKIRSSRSLSTILVFARTLLVLESTCPPQVLASLVRKSNFRCVGGDKTQLCRSP
jgi:hypothetical protein